MYNIEFYKDKNGKSEILEYIGKLQHSNSKTDRIKAKKIALYVDILSRYGLSIGEPYIKHVYNKIWELRPIRDRIFFTNICNNKFMLISEFTKKTQKTPKREIEKAMRLLEDYKKRESDIK